MSAQRSKGHLLTHQATLPTPPFLARAYPLLPAPVPLFEIIVLIRNGICNMSRALKRVCMQARLLAG